LNTSLHQHHHYHHQQQNIVPSNTFTLVNNNNQTETQQVCFPIGWHAIFSDLFKTCNALFIDIFTSSIYWLLYSKSLSHELKSRNLLIYF
jgi:hypothetical protein